MILLGIAAALLILLAVRVVQSLTNASKAKPVAVSHIQFKPTEVLTLGASEFAQTLPLSGTLNPYVQASVSARASGEVMQVLVREGQAVKQGELLAVLNDTTYKAQFDQAVANEKSALASLELAKKDYQNNAALVKDNFISPIALQKIEVTLASAQSQLQNAKQAKVIAQRALSEVNIKAPVAGIVSSRHVRSGETAAAGTPIFGIVNIDAFELQAPISAEQIGAIHQGQTVQLTSAGVEKAFNGVVERVNPAASNGSRSYVAYIRVDNPTGLLKAGMFAQGQIVISVVDGILSVPATALHTRDKTQYVYLIKDQKIAEQEVQTGAHASDAIDALVQVSSGLNAGDVVVRLDMGQLAVGTQAVLLNADGSSPEAGAAKAKGEKSWWQKLLSIFSAKG